MHGAIRWALALGVLYWANHCAAFDAPPAGSPPNMVLILADDLGYGDLGCYGQKKLATPRLDAMAQEGLRFTQFYAGAAVCAPSRCVLLTGKHGGRAAIRGNTQSPIVIPRDTPTIATLLKQAGYRTACIGKWGVGTPDNLTDPNDLGFEHFFGYVKMWHAHNCYPEFLVRNGQVVPLGNVVGAKWKEFQDPKLPQGGMGVAEKRSQYAPDLLLEDALRFIRDNRDHRFFLSYALNLPHANNEAGQQGMETPDTSSFANQNWPEPEKSFATMLQTIDRSVGRLLDLLRELKIDQNTLVLFTSDNGPHQEGGHQVDFFDSNGPLRGHKRDLLEGGIRVPTLAWWPGTIQPGREDDAHWYAGDILATAAELAGVQVPGDLDSESLAPILRGQPRAERWSRKARMYWECYEGASSQAVRFGKWKAIRSPMFSGPIELFDMSNDAGEKSNYAVRRPDLARHAANLFEKHHVPDPNWKVPAPR